VDHLGFWFVIPGLLVLDSPGDSQASRSAIPWCARPIRRNEGATWRRR
jgi:hypothetical protein